MLIRSDKWKRETDNADMQIRVYKVKGGIKSKMYINGEQCMDTFSLRPYKLGQSCDGTIDICVHGLFSLWCKAIGLNPLELYLKAYGEDGHSDLDYEWMEKQAIKEGVELPKVWGDSEFNGLIESLTEINNHSLVGVLLEII